MTDGVDWDDGVVFVDEVSVSPAAKLCPRCGAALGSAMAETDADGLGPAWACTDCGLVDRI